MINTLLVANIQFQTSIDHRLTNIYCTKLILEFINLIINSFNQHLQTETNVFLHIQTGNI
jgi:hypothetical protein